MSFSPYATERKFTRYSLDVRAKLSVDEHEITVRMLDVSEGGLGLVCPVEIPDGNRYAVEFVFPTMQDVFRAEVQAQSRNGFRHGFQYVELNESNLALVRKYQRRWGIRADENYARGAENK